ncbi:uncharacterized protein LOC135096008 isoform X2 [Scylla paramamosain]|uniref:uncharacterized protein LOC135096008 isoform X2 n=1 Tax=Scylla paramamosain TaxID=85552 RepID=UPI0030832D24
MTTTSTTTSSIISSSSSSSSSSSHHPPPCTCRLRRKQRFLAILSLSSAFSLFLLILHASSSSSSSSSITSSSYAFQEREGAKELPDRSQYVKETINFNPNPILVMGKILTPASYLTEGGQVRRVLIGGKEGVMEEGEGREEGMEEKEERSGERWEKDRRYVWNEGERERKGEGEEREEIRRGIKIERGEDDEEEEEEEDIKQINAEREEEEVRKQIKTEREEEEERERDPRKQMRKERGNKKKHKEDDNNNNNDPDDPPLPLHPLAYSPPPPPRPSHPPLLLSLDYSRQPYYPWRTTTDECANYATRFLVPGRAPIVALASFPGSGNTWLRYLAEALTGVFTGSVYHDEMLALRGFWGERESFWQGSTLLQKTHSLPLLPEAVKQEGSAGSGEFRFLLPEAPRRVVLLLRNPWECLLSLRHYHAAGHTGFGSSVFFRGQSWHNFTQERAREWVHLNKAWLTLPATDTLVLHYEHLQHRLEQEAGRLMTFLGLPLDHGRLECLLRRCYSPQPASHLAGRHSPTLSSGEGRIT